MEQGDLVGNFPGNIRKSPKRHGARAGIQFPSRDLNGDAEAAKPVLIEALQLKPKGKKKAEEAAARPAETPKSK
ncbi:hypothetical protein AMTR_s00038p00211080 [Amborella trichopoda]|uniref:Uncharacterized protein n=1 Tax=Amborella trichopoda TaxID=13333 RepID=U5CWZ2_AMBTC|nr:hypothetical protein AMTR_s00038p00211080 [Amborella trichopoda]